MISRRIRGVALVLCTAAIAAPAAQATTRPPEGAPRVGGQRAAVSPRLVPQPNQARGSDAYAVTLDTGGGTGAAPGGTGGGAGAAPPREPDEHGRGVAQQDTRPVVIDRRPIVLESGGFDWGDAGIGAAGAAGLVLVGGGAVLLARGGRRGQIATSE